jgi:hypothetical protein
MVTGGGRGQREAFLTDIRPMVAPLYPSPSTRTHLVDSTLDSPRTRRSPEQATRVRMRCIRQDGSRPPQLTPAYCTSISVKVVAHFRRMTSRAMGASNARLVVYLGKQPPVGCFPSPSVQQIEHCAERNGVVGEADVSWLYRSMICEMVYVHLN